MKLFGAYDSIANYFGYYLRDQNQMEIICSFGNTNGNGTQPISCITDYCLELYKNLSSKLEVLNYLLSAARQVDDIEVIIVTAKSPIDQVAYINSFNKKIYIEETFLSFLWIFIYTSILGFDENIQKKALGRPTDEEQLKTVSAMLDYASQLTTRFRIWDINALPNPAQHKKVGENYINLATMYFQYAFAFIILHELAHGLKGHDIPFQIKGQEEMIQDEYDVDRIAFMLLLESDLFKEDFTFKRDGAIMGLCALLFLSKGDNSASHPETADRVKKLIDLSNPGKLEFIWGIAAMCFQNWQIRFGSKQTLIPKSFESYIDYFNFMYALMKKTN